MAAEPRFNPARRLAARVLERVLAEGAYASSALDTALDKGRLQGRDAGLATHIVYGTLRYLPALERSIEPLLRPGTPLKARVLLYAGAFERFYLETPMHAVVNEYVELAKLELGKMSGLINAVLRRLEPPQDPYALPDWLRQEFEAVYGGQADAAMKSLLEPAPLWLWCSDEGIELLEEEGAVLDRPRGAVYQVGLDRSLRSSEAYRVGAVQPINPASLAVVHTLGAVSGQRVLDLAGGNGIKASFLARAGAAVLSVDLDARKHEAARKNLRRMGLDTLPTPVQFVQADLTAPLSLEPAALVLLDAPCSGTGTLRGHPEIKLRLGPQTVLELAALQGTLLEAASQQVAPGGVLVYSVCSVTRAEGVEVLTSFLERHPEFQPEAIALELPHVQAGVGVYTVPLEGLDGFYIARMRRLH